MTGTSTSTTFDTSNSNLILVGIVAYQAEPFPVLTDSKGNTWTALTLRTSTASQQHLKLFYCVNPVVGTGHTFTVTQGGGGFFYGAIQISWFSGASGGYDSNENGINGSASSTTSIQPGSLTPSMDGCLLATLIGFNASTTTPTIDLSFSVRTFTNYSGGNNFGGAFATLIETTAAAKNPTWSYASNVYVNSEIAVFRPSPTTEDLSWQQASKYEETIQLR